MTKLAPRPGNRSLKGSDLTPEQRHTSLACPATDCRGVKRSEGQAVISSCMRTALLSAGSAAAAAETNNVAAIIALASLSGIATISACMVIIIQSWNRDATIIDARARSRILRKWGTRASTPAEIERAATSAILPIILAREDMPADTETVIKLLQPTRPCEGNDH